MKKTSGKILATSLAALIAVPSVAAFSGCGGSPDLRVYNCYDYIDESLIEEFEDYYKEKTGKAIKVEYSCFDTPEDCYNSLKIDGSAYDLVCPSDYMIEKMAREDMLEEITMPEDGAYSQNVSPFIKNKFNEISWGDKSLANYAAGYMWGTLGLVYNTEKVNADDMKSWSYLWNDAIKGRFTIKNSVRDTYFIGLAKHYQAELESYKSLTDLAEYAAKLKDAFNDTEEATVNAVKNDLIDLKKRSKGLEVDSGKDDIIKGNIDVYFAWSGDAVYAMSQGLYDEEGNELPAEKQVVLDYSVPEEGSNVWFDGWCVPKGAKNKDLAIEFIDFISMPKSVIKNMDYIGYVSCIAGSDVFDWVKETYGSESGETTDLSYFFGNGNYSVTSEDLSFFAQYPAKSVIDRCVVMNYFPDAANERITNMWVEVIA